MEINFPDRSTKIGHSIDSYLKSKSNINDQSIHLLFSANRWELQEQIKNALNNGQHVICSRYAYSGVAYSSAKGLDFEWCKASDKGLICPDIVLYLKIDPIVASKRSQYGEEIYEKIEFQKQVLQKFETFEKEEQYWRTVNALENIEQIHDNIIEISENVINESSNKKIKKLWL